VAKHKRRVGASAEVIRHHAEVHPCGRHPAREVWCICGTTAALVCRVHREAVFGVVMPGTWCIHAVELLGPKPEVAA
jgi:hypothetical protein